MQSSLISPAGIGAVAADASRHIGQFPFDFDIYILRRRVDEAHRDAVERFAFQELWPEVGDGRNRKGGISWECLTTPLLHRRSDMPCLKITLSS
jgi:hypothetical protein